MINEYIGTGANIRKEVLDSGLTVYFLPFNNRSNFYFDYVTKYGALINTFKLDNEKSFKKEPYGIAHFLEHKLFEQEDGHDPFEFFSKYGIDCNASTGYKSTSYYIEGTNNQKEGLDFLISMLIHHILLIKMLKKKRELLLKN
jgi:predicted Zn-dependent peptidase